MSSVAKRKAEIASSTPGAIRVGLDARCLNREHLRGMGKYVANVMSAMPNETTVRWELFADRPDLPMHASASQKTAINCFEQRGHRFNAWEQFALGPKAKKFQCDVLHATSTTLPWRQSVPTVVTIHDTVPWDGGEEAVNSWFWTWLLPKAYRKCAAIITISESSKRDIVRLWPDLADKLHVIPHGVESHYLDAVPSALCDPLRSLGITSPYLLYLGGAIPRKRLDWAIQVWQQVADPQLQLVVCGLESEAQAGILERLPADSRSKICFPPFVSEEQMPRLYQNAVGVLYPTLYEGFGLPALEAQAVGAPVLFSRVGSLAELDGPGAMVLPTDDLSAWVNACKKLVEQRREHPSPIVEARKWAGNFSWEISARGHLDVYRQVRST